MSGAIRDLERLNSRQLETLKNRQTREVKNLEKAHQNYKAELKNAHAEEITDLNASNLQHVSLEAEKKEKVLGEMRSHLKTTQDLTEKQLKALKESAIKERAETQAKLTIERDRVSNDAQLYMDELNSKIQAEARKLNVDGQQRVNEINQKNNRTFSDTVAFHQDKLNHQKNEFTARFQKEELEQKRIKDETDTRYKKERLATNQRQQSEMAKMTDNHNTVMEQRDTQYRTGLKDQDLFFEKKFAVNLEGHNKNLKSLDETHGKIVHKMKTDLTKDVTKIVERADDPFYQFTELRPILQKFEDRVEVQVKVPEYAKSDISLATNNKEVILNFNRRYTDSKISENVKNKVNKVETFTSRIDTGEFLNARSVTSNYKNGVMTYIIKKA